MIRKSITLSDRLDDRVEAEAARLGVSASDVIRRALDEHFDRKDKAAQQGGQQ
jgi:predicted transcriptional regulator